MNPYINQIEEKIKSKIKLEEIKIIDNTESHKRHKSFQKGKLHLILEIKSSYLKINQSIDDSSYLLGYSKFRTFRKIHFPNLKNSIYLISILIAIEIIKELPITLILRPFNFETFATKAYAFASQDLLEAAALPSLFLIFWSAILIFFTSKHILSEK